MRIRIYKNPARGFWRKLWRIVRTWGIGMLAIAAAMLWTK